MLNYNVIPQNNVFIVDDDTDVRESLALLFEIENFQVHTFTSATEFLKFVNHDIQGCLILDLMMPGMSGLELQAALKKEGIDLPIIFNTAFGDVSSAVKAMKMGSFDFFEKPYPSQLLIERVYKAIQLNNQNRLEFARKANALEKMKLLTEREKEILALVVEGRTSKTIADLLNLSVSTVDNHRAKILKKFEAETVADLTRIALIADPHLLKNSSK